MSKLTQGVSHVGISVRDVDESLKFFEALGFNKVGGDDKYPSVFVSDGTSMITLWQSDANPTPFDRRKNIGLHHLAIRVTSREALDEAYKIVSDIPGVRIDGEGAFAPQPLGTTTWSHAILYEPSGNRIELTHQG